MICPCCHQETETHDGRLVVHGDCPGGFALVELADSDRESRYTDPRPDCPHPERWHSDDWDSTEREVTELVAAFVRALRPDNVLETGTAFGQTAEAIGIVLDYGNYGGRLVTIEIDEVRADLARKRCDGLPVTVVNKASLDVEPDPAVPFGFAWFDSLLPLRVPEFRHFYDVLAPGAIVAFHDTAPHHGKTLWNEILTLEGEGLLFPMRLNTPRGVVFGEVRTGRN